MTRNQKNQMQALGHSLKPTVSIGGRGLSQGCLMELDRALRDHELIKVKIRAIKPKRVSLTNLICEKTGCELISLTGTIALFFRPSVLQKPRLSNLIRPIL